MTKIRLIVAVLIGCLAVGTISFFLIREHTLHSCQPEPLTVDNAHCASRLSLLTLDIDGKPASAREAKTIAITPDGSLVAILDNSGEIRVWSLTLQGYKEMARLDTKPSSPKILALSSDGRFLAFSQSGVLGDSLEVWDTQTERMQSFYQGAEAITTVTFGPGGKLLAFAVASPGIAPMTTTLQLWDVASRQRYGDIFTGASHAALRHHKGMKMR